MIPISFYFISSKDIYSSLATCHQVKVIKQLSALEIFLFLPTFNWCLSQVPSPGIGERYTLAEESHKKSVPRVGGNVGPQGK